MPTIFWKGAFTMKNLGRAVLLLMLGLMMLAPAAMAQDALSVVLPSPYSSRVGSQLVYFWEDGANLGARGSFQSYLTIVNTNITTAVTVHFQVYQVVTSSASGGFSCIELFDIVDGLTPGQRYIFDPKNMRRPLSGALIGQATGGRFMMTASAVYLGIVTTGLADLRLISFNWLSGQIWMSDVIRASTRATNAVPRMAVDSLGGPLGPGVLLVGGAGSAIPGTIGCPGAFSCFTGVGPTYLQMFRPQILAINSFFRTASPNGVQQGVPFGNRLTLITFTDQYFGTDPFFRLIPATATLTSFVFDDAENPYSITPRPFTCVKEFTLAPDVPGASGNWEDFLGTPLTSAVAATGGWLRMRVSDLTGAPLQSIFGWFSQALGPFGGGDLLIGIGRQGSGALFTTTTAGSGTVVTASSTQAP
jgi:hypothetical protein